MVNPISAHTGSLHFVPASTDLERPVSIPEPAVQVTASSKTLSSGSHRATLRHEQKLDPIDTSFDKALEQVNDNMKAWATGMRFNVDAEAQRVVVSIVDNATGEILRTVPSEAVIRIAKMIVQMQGNFVSTKV